ncbi:MAG: metal-dependent hydrolase [Sulfurovum sp.]|nr:metal-dependent hydrolase [Sulfurovum sp.]
MKIIIADYIYTTQGYLDGKAVAFNHEIKAIDSADTLTERYPDAQIIRMQPHSIIYPGLINTHVHLEFSANSTTLEYGEFMSWLHSVIEHRDELIRQCDDTKMIDACDEMLRSGITSFGAISSFGADLEVCKKTPQRVTFFNELIGSDAKTVDMLYADFLERLKNSESSNPKEKVTPAIAIHSPYSVHPIVLQRAVSLAKQKKYPLSTHFLESPAEREWLESNKGGFATFFAKFFGSSQAVTTIEEFMCHFNGYPAHFVHCVQTTKEEKSYLLSQGHSIAHCPRSNRLLGCGRLAIEDWDGIMSVATDGLSSNWSLNLWDELRSTLMLQHKEALGKLADRLIRSVTADAAKAIRSDAGRIELNAPADLTIITLPNRCEKQSLLSLNAILHTQEASFVYIAGEQII